MMEKEFDNKIARLLNNPNLEEELKNLSYEEKEKILISNMFSCYALVKYCISEKIQILNSEQSIFFYNNNPDFFMVKMHCLDQIY